jgi:hypothetical protein
MHFVPVGAVELDAHIDQPLWIQLTSDYAPIAHWRGEIYTLVGRT